MLGSIRYPSSKHNDISHHLQSALLDSQIILIALLLIDHFTERFHIKLKMTNVGTSSSPLFARQKLRIDIFRIYRFMKVQKVTNFVNSSLLLCILMSEDPLENIQNIVADMRQFRLVNFAIRLSGDGRPTMNC